MNALRTARPPRGPQPRDIIAHTRTLAAPGARCHRRAQYIQAFFRNVDWTAVNRRLREAAAV